MINSIQDYNPITGDTQLNPAAFGLNMGDIDNENLRTQIQSGRITLTSDQYRELERISYEKFTGLDQYGRITQVITGSILPVTDPDGDPGLYMNNQYIGFWSGTEWKGYMSNAGNFFYGDVSTDNFIEWDSSAGILSVKGDIVATSVSAEWIYGGNIHGDQIEANTITTSSLNFVPVDTANVIASINASTEEGLTITADKITISGTTTFTSGYDPTTKETPEGAQAKTDALASNLGNLAYDDLVAFNRLGTTIVDGAYLKTGLINVGTIVIGDLSGAGALASQNTVAYSTEVTGTPNLGNLAYDDLVAFNRLGTTIVDGAFLQTGLIKVDEIFAQTITASGTITGGTFKGGEYYTTEFNDGDISSGETILLKYGKIDFLYNGESSGYMKLDESLGSYLRILKNVTSLTDRVRIGITDFARLDIIAGTDDYFDFIGGDYVDFNSIELKGIKNISVGYGTMTGDNFKFNSPVAIHSGTSDGANSMPSTDAMSGQMHFETDLNKLRIYNGSARKSITLT